MHVVKNDSIFVFQVIRSLKRALQPAVTDVSILFQVPKEYEVLQSPTSLPPIFNGERLVSYAVLKTKKSLKKAISCTAILKGNMLGAKQEHKIPFTLDRSAAVPSLPVIHHLAAKALITDWETENKEKKSIVDLSIESSVISSHTAFIAIDGESSEPVSGAMKTYDVQAESFMSQNIQYLSSGTNFCELGGGKRSGLMMNMYSSQRSDFCGDGSGGGGGGGGGIRSAGVMKKILKSSASLFKRRGMVEKSLGPTPPMCAPHPVPLSLPAEPLCGAHPPLPPPRSCAPRPVPRSLPAEPICGAPPPIPPPRSNALMMQGMSCPSASAGPLTNPSNTLANLITAQQVNGSWALTSSFAQLLGKSLLELETACPIEKKGDGATVWATILAVSLLRVKYSNQQDEWELIVMKAESWLKKQTLPPGSTLAKLFEAAQKYI